MCVRDWVPSPPSSAALGCSAPSFYPPEKFVCRKPTNCLFQEAEGFMNSGVVLQPLEGLHQLAQQILQVEDLLHQETFHRRLLSAGRVDALSRLPPHQDLMLEFWKTMAPRSRGGGKKSLSLMQTLLCNTHANTPNAALWDGKMVRRIHATREGTWWLCRYNHSLCRYQ